MPRVTRPPNGRDGTRKSRPAVPTAGRIWSAPLRGTDRIQPLQNGTGGNRVPPLHEKHSRWELST